MDEAFRDKVVQSFPYPVAKQFVKLGTDECLDPGPNRMKYILATSEAVARFLGIVVLCECRELLEHDQQAGPGALSAKFQDKFRHPSFGFWLRVVREGLGLLSERARQPLIAELPGFYFERPLERSVMALALDELLDVRNDLTHERIEAFTIADYRRLCDQTFPVLCRVLEGLAFLTRYQMAFHSAIEVHKPRRGTPRFLHRYKVIKGTSDFRGDRKTLDRFMDPQAVILMETCADGEPPYLSLDPLLVYEEDAGRAPDIFYFNGMKEPPAAEFTSCSRGRETFSSSRSTRAAEIASELEHVLALFARPPAVDGAAS